jgi:hypothetical protein
MHENHEKWLELCALAAMEQDHDRLLELSQEINRLLEEKEQRLKKKPPTSQSDGFRPSRRSLHE